MSKISPRPDQVQRQLKEPAWQRPLPSFNRLQLVIITIASVVVMGLFLASAVAAPPSERSDASKHVLRNVPELDKRVTFTETKIPLGEVVQKIAADTGARVTAAPEVADEPVAVVVKEMPARDLLEQLADLLDYTWSRRGNGEAARCEIWQDLASKQREEALRNSLRADVIRRFQADLHRYVEMADWTPERLQKFIDDAGRPARADDLNANERDRRFHLAWIMMSPISRGVTQLLSRLSPEQWSTVREGKTLTLSTDPQPGELAMPAETERLLRAAKPTLNPPGQPVQYGDPNGPERTRHIDQGLQEQWAAATGYRVTIQINPENWRNRNMLQLTAAARPFRTGAPPRSEFFDAYPGTSVQIQTEPGDPWEADLAQPGEEDLAKDPVFGARKLFKPEAKSPFKPDDEMPSPAMFPLRDLLPDLARTYKVQFIADAYTPARARLNGLRSTEPEPLYRLLSGFAKPTHLWDHHGNLIRMRSRTWFLDRPKEIPLRLVRHWKELTDQHGALPFETYLEMASSFSDLQMENLAYVGEDVKLPETLNMFLIGRSRYGLRLYDALLPDQQQALRHGKSLPLAQMTAAQQQLFLANLAERGRYEPYPMKLERPSDGRLSLDVEPRTLTVERRAGSTSTRLEPASPAGGSGQPPPRPATNSGAPASLPNGVTHFPVNHLDFHFWYAPDQEDTLSLTVAAPG